MLYILPLQWHNKFSKSQISNVFPTLGSILIPFRVSCIYRQIPLQHKSSSSSYSYMVFPVIKNLLAKISNVYRGSFR